MIAVVGGGASRRWWATTVIAGIGSGVALTTAARATDGLPLQFAGTSEALARALRAAGDDLDRHLVFDFAFIALFAIFVVGLVRLVEVVPRGEHGRLLRVQWALLLAPLALDVVENSLLVWADDGRPELAGAIEGIAALKWIGYAGLATALVTMLVLRVLGPTPRPDPDPRHRPMADELAARWNANTGGLGIALSGGGIRSAAFALGGLKALGNERVRGARYLSAASGGAYLAAAMTHQAHREGAPTDRLPFDDGSEELVRLRARSSWLALNGEDGRIGVFRALASIAFNIAVLWLVAFALARPVGWLISSEALHPELLARTPLIEGAELHRDVTRDDLTVTAPAACDLADGCAFAVAVAPSAIESRVARSRTVAPAEDPRRFRVTWKPGIITVKGTTATIDVQPRASVHVAGLVDSRTDEGRPPLLELTRQVELDLDDDAVAGAGAAAVASALQRDLLRVEQQPRFVQQTGFRGRPDIEIDGWMLAAPAIALAIAVLAVTVVRRGVTTELRGWASVPLTLAVAGFAVLVAAPLLLQWLPSAAETVFDWIPGAPALVPGEPAGFGLWLAALVAAGQAVRTLLKRVPSTPGRGRQVSRLLLKATVFVLLVGAGAALVFAVLQQAALNGPMGRLAGLGALWWLPGLAHVPDIVRWAAVVGVLGVLALVRPAHHWSFQPLYRDRLAEAFSLTDRAVISKLARQEATRSTFDALHTPTPWPELVICAAVNLNDTDPGSRIPAGRWAGSFTFSAGEIGGPDVGYLPTTQYESRLAPLSRRDVDLASVVGVSGAAFSPAMGKFAYGAIGGLFAVLNLRLGLWLPNPAWLSLRADEGWWRRRPGWTYLLRELFGRFRRHRPYLYVTDGGHWENLGLVELLRRRCTDIVVISAAGDGAQSFATIAEALALAREQCGVDVTIDLSPMRPPAGAADVTARRQLLRADAKGELVAAPLATKPYAVGRFRFPAAAGQRQVRGRILVVEATLTADMPWDVHAWAESQAIFPDDPTTDQFFNHRQFESYRRLGLHQVAAGLASEEWEEAGLWVAGRATSSGTPAGGR